jgi:alpha-beta hydrolase superfamily lysophospholipase
VTASQAGAGGVGASHYFDASDGLRLHYRAWPVPEPRAALLVLHGLFEHSRRYIELAGVVGDAGVATFALDHRGHGASEGKRGHVDPFDQFIEDAARFRAEVEGRLPGGTPCFLLGHSMGGLIGIRFLETRRPPLRGAIFSAPWLGMTEQPAWWERAAARVLNRVAPRFAYPSPLDPADLSHDPERVADYREDPEIFSRLTPRLFHEVQKVWDAVPREVDRIEDLPLLFLLPGEDRVADAALSEALAHSIDGADVTIRWLEGYFHEVLQEVERAAVLAEVRDWIGAHLP